MIEWEDEVGESFNYQFIKRKKSYNELFDSCVCFLNGIEKELIDELPNYYFYSLADKINEKCLQKKLLDNTYSKLNIYGLEKIYADDKICWNDILASLMN